ncbi:MAG: c-type cytochrome [Bacteroidetes bacterium]|nr:c-type cytochrome [Bacteroidota bacterium]
MASSYQQQNHAPVVKINTPANNATFAAGSPISYQVSVSDKEDGDTKFDEINLKEILLQVNYVKDQNKIAALLKSPVADDPLGLAVITRSNCFNCHNFNSKSIGPSFFEICKHYPPTKANADSLVSRIKKGSSGLWPGKEKMPAHPELTDEEIRSTVQWVFKNESDPNITYYNSTPGLIRIPPDKPGTYIITASYTDHGVKGTAEKRLKGYDRILISVK